jgi:predicted ribosomally synthesized peptide with SipW-like signal peptide
MKKIGLLALTLIIALGALGIGYAAWTDQVTVTGTVNTGSVDIGVTDFSGTWVWKVPTAAHEIVVTTTDVAPAGALDMNPDVAGIQPVAYSSAVAGPQGGPDVVVTFDNIFPDIDFEADVTLTYNGTIPCKINDITYNFTNAPWIGEWVRLGYIYATARDASGNAVLAGYQLHQGDTVHIIMHILIPEDNSLMSKSGSFSANLQVVQWNEYPYTAPVPAPTAP